MRFCRGLVTVSAELAALAAVGGTIGTGIFLSAGIVRCSSSFSHCYMKLMSIVSNSRLCRLADLEVHCYHILFLAYLFTP